MTKDFTLSYGTIKLVKELLSVGGWANEIIDIYNAGKLIETLPEEAPENFSKTTTITLSDKQFNTIVKALKFSAEKSIILPSPFAVQAIEQFELL